MVIAVGVLFPAVLFSGCDSKTSTPQTPQVVTKKLVQEKAPDSTAVIVKPVKTETKETTEAAKAIPAPTPAKEETVQPSQESPGTQPAPKPSDVLAALGTGIQESTVSSGISYNPEGKIDPFEPLFRREPTEKTAKKKTRQGPLTPLERVDISQLKLTGVIMAPSGSKALISEASGKAYIAKEGTLIGMNSGRIIRILKDRIIVEEEVEDLMGNVTLQKKEMTLQKPPGE
jgi:type IV pilus assembly protein PilP